MKYASFCAILLALLSGYNSFAQPKQIAIDPNDQNNWQVTGRTAKLTEPGKVELSSGPGEGMLILKNSNFNTGTIEFDIKGEDKMGQSFVGLAFHIQNEQEFEVVYFRPFNFFNPDTVRRWRAVQYVYMPNYPWEKLRESFPGKYENKIANPPDPNGWFHAKIVIKPTVIEAYMNNSSTPCLVVKPLSTLKNGKIALWVGDGSKGNFSNLVITPDNSSAQIPYGNNPAVGKYFDVGDAKLYYEVYGKGEPIVMLHGGVYGYIDEFASFIDALSKTNQVICIGTRGHGKSEIGNQPFTWAQRAEDAYKLTRSITKDSVIVLGFSDGGGAALKLASTHPELVKRLIAIGYGGFKDPAAKPFNYNPDMLMSQAKDLFEQRKSLMPQPERWGECLTKLNGLYNSDFNPKATLPKIKCPTLLMAGDRDDYNKAEFFVQEARLIPHSQLSIIAGCSHVVFFCNWPAVWAAVGPFLGLSAQTN